ncbi:MAG: hypothetical protein EOO77_37055, partial [Oxalobacteraceae bacterium]
MSDARRGPRSASWAGTTIHVAVDARADLHSVDEYVIKSATLRLKYNHNSAGPSPVANVHVEHVLERLKPHEL